MSNTAQKILIPDSFNQSTFRIAFLYVGQGEATLLIIPKGDSRRLFVLIDNNKDEKNGGINTVKLLKDLLNGSSLDVFINTHPHSDHLEGIKDIHNEVGIKEVWHSGLNPGKDYDEAYQELKDVIKDIGENNEYILRGTNELNKVRKCDKCSEVNKPLGDINYQVFSPAEYVAEDIDKLTGDERYRKIHEYCSVIKFSYGTREKHVLITGDSDKKAWKEHITDYHGNKLASAILSASHHGSRTFFKCNEDDEDIYRKHMDNINPSDVIISAPHKSPHNHPHRDALNIYEEYVDKDNIHYMGKSNRRISFIVDIYNNGDININQDEELSKEYGSDSDETEKTNDYGNINIITSRIEDSRPMG